MHGKANKQLFPKQVVIQLPSQPDSNNKGSRTKLTTEDFEHRIEFVKQLTVIEKIFNLISMLLSRFSIARWNVMG